MTSRGDYYTEWEWNAERQKLRRELRDYRGRVLRVQFGEPLYSSAGDNSEQQADREQDGANDNYTTRPPQRATTQQDEFAFPNPYGTQRTYNPPPLNQSSSLQNTAGFYAAPANLYGSQPRYGFPAAQNAQPGFSGWYGASNQPPAPSGYQDQYGSPHSQHQVQHQVLGNPAAFPQSDPQHLSTQTVQPGYPSQYSPAGAHMAAPTYPYQPGELQEWSTEYDNKSRGHAEQMGSTGVQQYNNAVPGQSAPSVFPEPYSARLGDIAPSGQQANVTPTDQSSYLSPTSTSVQDEGPSACNPTPKARVQSMYPGSYIAKVDSSISQAEPKGPHSYEDDSTVDVKIEVATSKSSQGMNPEYS